MVSILIKEMQEYATKNNVPIMIDESIKYITNIIETENIKSILEIGTAIGYSTIRFRNVNDYINITSIERDIQRYNKAKQNVNKSKLNNINLVLADALEIEIQEKYDLIIIDAAKAQNIKFFNKYKNNLNDNGIIIIDNMNFHGLVHSNKEIKSRNVRALIRKLENFWEFLENQSEYNVEHINIGDGLAVCKKINS